MKVFMRALLDGGALAAGFFTTGEVIEAVKDLTHGPGTFARDIAVLLVLAFVLYLNRHGDSSKTEEAAKNNSETTEQAQDENDSAAQEPNRPAN